MPGSELQQHGAGLGEQVTAAAQQRDGVPADADVAVGEHHVLPAALGGQALERVAVQHGGAAPQAPLDRLDRDVDAERGHPAVGERDDEPARPAPEVERGAEATLQQPAVVAVGVVLPALHRQREHDPVGAHQAVAPPGERGVEHRGAAGGDRRAAVDGAAGVGDRVPEGGATAVGETGRSRAASTTANGWVIGDRDVTG